MREIEEELPYEPYNIKTSKTNYSYKSKHTINIILLAVINICLHVLLNDIVINQTCFES